MKLPSLPLYSLCAILSLAYSTSLSAMDKHTMFITDSMDYNSRLEAISDAGTQVLTGSGSYTLSAWVKLNLYSLSFGRYHPIMGQCRNDGGIFRLYYDAQLGQFVFGRGTRAALEDAKYLHAPTSKPGEWNFVTAVYDQAAQECRLYLNGVLMDTKAATDTITLASGNIFRVGFSYYNNQNQFFRGNIAEMSVWDVALDSEKIHAIMTARPMGSELEHCRVYWPMDEKNATFCANDFSDHGIYLWSVNGSSTHMVMGTLVSDFPEFEVPHASLKNVLHFTFGTPSSYIRPSAGDLKAITTDGSFTISAWVKQTRYTGRQGAYSPIFSQDPWLDYAPTKINKIRFFYEKATHSYVFERFSASGTVLESNPVKAVVESPSEWTYVTAVYDKENAKRMIYLNGQLAASMDDEAVFTPNCNWFRIGFAYINNNNYFLHGYLSEMSVWDRALSAEKIQSIMTARPCDEDLEGCVGYWTFAENVSSATCADTSLSGALSVSNPDLTRFVPSTEVAGFPAFEVALPVNVLVPEGLGITVTELSETDRADGRYYEGSIASFTAACEGRRFVGWNGNIPADQVGALTTQFEVREAVTIMPYFVDSWQFVDASKKVITDGYWKLNVAVTNGVELVVTGVNANPYKMGLLDLSAPVDGGNYSIVDIGTSSFSKNKDLVELYLPETLRVISGKSWETGAFYQCSNLRKVSPFMPDSLCVLGGNLFEKCYALTGDLVLGRKGDPFRVLPKPTYDDECIFRDTAITSVDAGKGFTAIPIRMFSTCTQLTNVVLRGATSLGRYVFNNCAKLDDLWLYEKPTWDMNNDSFPNYNGRHRWHVLAENEEWQAFLADPSNVTPWDSLDAATKNVYLTNYPGEKKPVGQMTDATKTKKPWILTFSLTEKATVIYIR